MSIKSNLAKAVPNCVLRRIRKRGRKVYTEDSNCTVLATLNTVCDKKCNGTRTEYIYNGKVVGWYNTANSAGWCDDEIYPEIREKYQEMLPTIVAENTRMMLEGFDEVFGDYIASDEDLEEDEDGIDWAQAYSEEFHDEDE